MIELGKRSPDWKAIKWVAKAMPEVNNRATYGLDLMKVDKSVAYGVDGRRLHWATLEADEVPDGLYRIVVNKATQIILAPDTSGAKFPKVEMFIPDMAKATSLGTIGAYQTNKPERLLCMFARKFEGGLIDFGVIADSFVDNDMEVWATTAEGPIRLEAKDHHAVVMPMRAET